MVGHKVFTFWKVQKLDSVPLRIHGDGHWHGKLGRLRIKLCLDARDLPDFYSPQFHRRANGQSTDRLLEDKEVSIRIAGRRLERFVAIIKEGEGRARVRRRD